MPKHKGSIIDENLVSIMYLHISSTETENKLVDENTEEEQIHSKYRFNIWAFIIIYHHTDDILVRRVYIIHHIKYNSKLNKIINSYHSIIRNRCRQDLVLIWIIKLSTCWSSILEII